MGDEVIKEPQVPGSEPGAGQVPASPPGAGAVAGESPTPDLTKPPPFDSDPRWKSARSTEKAVNDLLEKTGMESLDQLDEFLTSSQEIREKLVEQEVDEVLADSQELRKVHAFWAEQEEKNKRISEQPEETISRLEREKVEERNKRLSIEESDQAIKQAEKAIKDYTSTVDGIIDSEAKDLGPAVRTFLGKYLGINNAFNDVDITDKVAVRKMAKDGVKDFRDGLVQAVLKDYKAGKLKLIDVSPAEHIAPDIREKGPGNLKEARGLFMESLQGMFKRT